MNNQTKLQLIEAANENDGFALTLLGVLLVNGRKEVEDGVNKIFFAADAKNVMWAKNIKRYLQAFNPWELPIHHHALVDSDTREQLEIYSEEGNMWAMTILGDLCYQGKVTIQNRSEAAILLNKAANKGCLFAKELIEEYGIQRQCFFATEIHSKVKDKSTSRFWLK